MASLDGRVIAIAGAAGGLGPVVAAAARRRPAPPWRSPIATRAGSTRSSPISGWPRSGSTHGSSTCSTRPTRGGWAKAIEERFGRVDGLLHLVGGWKGGEPLATAPLDDYEWLHDLLVRTVIHTTRAFYDALAASEHGRFVLVSSSQAQSPGGTNAAYGATKAAAESWTLALADAFREAGSAATANIVVVNAIVTPRMRAESPDKPFKTFTSAEEIAAALEFVCSDAAAQDERQAPPALPVSGPADAPTDFASDNHAGAHPEVLEAIAAANAGHAGAYGADPWTARAEALVAEHFGGDARAFFVFNGTGANVASIDALTRPFEAVICTDVAHMHVDECAAPERLAGVKLLTVPHRDGKLSPADVRLWDSRRGDEHQAQPRGGLDHPVDRARNALPPRRGAGDRRRRPRAGHARARRRRPARERRRGARRLARRADRRARASTWSRSGGPRTGSLFGEAVVFCDPELGRDFLFTRKQLGQLPSKMRFVAAQFEALLSGDLWLRSAAHANEMAARLAAAVGADRRGRDRLPGRGQRGLRPARAAGDRPAARARCPADHPFYVWDEADGDRALDVRVGHATGRCRRVRRRCAPGVCLKHDPPRA